MRNTGFVIKNKSKGREYFYLRKSIRVNGIVKKQNIYSFGTKDKALKNLLEWINDSKKIPLVLTEMGYNKNDVIYWIEEIKKK